MNAVEGVSVLLHKADRRLPRRLTTRMTLAVVVIVVAAGLITTGIINEVLSASLRSQSVLSGQALAQELGESLANDLVEGDLSAVQESISGAVEQNESIVYAFAFGPDTPIVHSFPGGFPADLMQVSPMPLDQPSTSQLLATNLGRVRDFGYRPLDGLPAEVHLGISEEGMIAVQRQVTEFVLALTVVGLLLAAVVANWFGRMAVSPLKELTQRVHQLGRGSLDQRIDLPPGDEVGDLAEAFNQMASEIQSVIQRLRTSEAGYGDLLTASGTVGEGIALICDDGPDIGKFLYVNDTFAHLTGHDPRDLQGRDAESALHPGSLRDARASWAAIRTGGSDMVPTSEFTLWDEHGQERAIETAGTMIEYQGVRAVAWFVRDVTDRMEREEELRRRNRELAALNAVASALNSPVSVDEMLDKALQEALAALEMDVGWVLVFDESGDSRLAACRGLVRENDTFAFPACACGRVVTGGVSVAIDEVGESCALSCLPVRDGRPLSCHMAVPVQARGQVLGVLSIASNRLDTVGEDDVVLLEAMGRQIGVALENARLWDELRSKEKIRGELLARTMRAQEDERQRISRELHDGVGQSLNALVFGLNAVSTALSQTPDSAPELLERLNAAVSEAVKELQDIIYDLRPSLLDDLGLCRAVHWYTQERLQGRGVRVTLDVPETLRLQPDIETALFRVTQEAITNIAKHARAGHVDIVLHRAQARIHMEIRDDGVGFDSASVLTKNGNQRGWGLLGMMERVTLLDGEFTVESEPGQGTRLTIDLPLEVP